MIDSQMIATGLSSIAAVSALVWGWVQKQRTVVSETKARVAEDDRDREMANSAQTLYSMMNERLKTVENEMRDLKMYSRKLELHISKLEFMMRQAGLTPPQLDE